MTLHNSTMAVLHSTILFIGQPQLYFTLLDSTLHYYTVKTWVLNNTPQFAAQFMGCYYNTDQVKGVKKGVKGDNWQSITPLTPLHRVLEN